MKKIIVTVVLAAVVGLIAKEVQATMEVRTFEVKIVDITVDGRGVRTYKAREDQRPVDGYLQEIIVKDNSRSLCEMVYAAPTMIEFNSSYYDRQGGKAVNLHHFLTADQLELSAGF